MENELKIGDLVIDIFSRKKCRIVGDNDNPLIHNSNIMPPLYPIGDNDCILQPIDSGELIHTKYVDLDRL